MPLAPNTRIGPYEIKSPLGEGGMGVVYRATDVKLHRDVALKVLPDDFVDDPDRLSRFQREAQVLASLNHPGIAQIYGLEDSGNTRCIVMELVDGETLQQQLTRGAIPVDEALQIAKQIAEALEAAHEGGIVHRDLKPGNIMMTADGKVKVLDFGLAKALQKQHSSNLSNSPTMVSAGSMPNVIIGTAAYMSPEQAKGKEVDRRTDIFAFGCVLFEMLTAKRAFDGEDVTEILGRVVTAEPNWALLGSDVPAGVKDVLRLCLEKNIRNRRSDASDVRIDIEKALVAPATAAALPARSGSPSRPWIILAAALAMSTVTLSVPAWRYFRQAAPQEIRFEVNTPSTPDPVWFAISPDGRQLVYVASRDGKSLLWVRPLDSLGAQALAGTEGASFPFWSPDSASLGFFADGKLKRTDIVGGGTQTLSDAPGAGREGAWNRDGVIVFSKGGRLLKILATGSAVVTVDLAGVTPGGGYYYPQFLPDGRHFIFYEFTSHSEYVASLDGGPSHKLLNAEAAAVVSPAGFLFFARETTLFLQAFDFQRLEVSGNPIRVAESLVSDSVAHASGLSVTAEIVAYRTGAAAISHQLTWLDRSGKTVATLGALDRSNLFDVALSPDAKHVAVARTVNGNQDIWLFDVIRGVPTRFTFDAVNNRPVWSPDGLRVVFASNRSGTGAFSLYQKEAGGAGGPELLLELGLGGTTPNDWSPDGRFLIYQIGNDLWVLPDAGKGKPFPFIKTPLEESEGQFSPNGHWVSYASNESGRFEIYVQAFPGPGGKFQISTNGGAQPRWNKNGKELFYVSLDSKMMATPVAVSRDGQSLEAGTPAPLFPARVVGDHLRAGPGKQQYAVSADGQRFLVNLEVGEETASPITLIYHWKPPK